MAQKNSLNKATYKWMRVIHRYAGFLLIFTMMVYAISGIVLVYRDTGIFKKTVHVQQQIEPNVELQDLGMKLRLKNLQILSHEDGMVKFKEGYYNSRTGMAEYDKQDYPWLLKKVVSWHTVSSQRPLSFMAVVFAISLFFFALSSFWMFPPKSAVFKRGAKFMVVGLILALVVVFI